MSTAVQVAVAAEFHRFCVVCSMVVPEDRLRRGAHTCSKECGKADKGGMRRFKAALRLQRSQKSVKA